MDTHDAAPDLAGRTLDGPDLSGATLRRATLAGLRIERSELTGVVMSGVEVRDCVIEGDVVSLVVDGDVESLVVNGVDVAPLVEAELDRRDPRRVVFRPTTADGFREAWAFDEALWASTEARALALGEDVLHESVGGEWSFVQTLRHLAFASQAWVLRAVAGTERPWHPLSLPWDQMEPREGVPHDRDARPSVAEALDLRHRVLAEVRTVLADLTDARLDEPMVALTGPGWPDPGATYPVRTCLRVVLNEEWHHRLFAERDLAVLEGRG